MRHSLCLILVTVAAVLTLSDRAHAENADKKAAKEYEERLRLQRQSASLQQALNNATTPQQRRQIEQQLQELKQDIRDKKDFAEFKQKTLDNLAAIKELYAKAEESWKLQQFGQAGAMYGSVALATVPGAEQMAETARGRLVEIEDLAKQHLKNAEDADLRREYVKEVEELMLINREFQITQTREVAMRRLINLKGRPEVAGYVELSQAENLETEGKISEAAAQYQAIAANPRYENSVAALKAKRKLEELGKNENARALLKAEADAKTEREAPVLLNSARNFMSNNMPKKAIEKLQILLEKYPESKYADEARKLMAELK